MTDHKMTPQQYRQRWDLPSFISAGCTRLCEDEIGTGKEDWAGTKKGQGASMKAARMSRKRAKGYLITHEPQPISGADRA